MSYRQVIYICPEAKFLMNVCLIRLGVKVCKERGSPFGCDLRLCPIAGPSVEMKTASDWTIAGKAALHLQVQSLNYTRQTLNPNEA